MEGSRLVSTTATAVKQYHWLNEAGAMRLAREWEVHGRDTVDSLNKLLVTNVRTVDEGVVPVKAVDPVRKPKWRGVL